MSIDFNSEDFPMPDDASMHRLSNLAQAQISAEEMVASLEEKLKAAKARLQLISEVQLPTLMAELNFRQLTLGNGATIEVKKEYFGSISAERIDKAAAWLRANGYASIVRNDITLNFGVGEDEKAKEIIKQLTEDGLVPTQKTWVHASTLKALVKELYEKGAPFPEDLFAAHSKSSSVIKSPNS